MVVDANERDRGRKYALVKNGQPLKISLIKVVFAQFFGLLNRFGQLVTLRGELVVLSQVYVPENSEESQIYE